MPTPVQSLISARKIFLLVALNLIVIIALAVTYFMKKPSIETGQNLTVIPNVTGFPTVPYSIPSPRSLISPTLIPNPLPFATDVFTDGYRIGNVKIYQNDLERKFSLYYPNSIEARSNLDNWQKIADLISSDAILLNEAVRADLFVPAEVTAIDPYKVNQARNYFQKQGTSYVNAEMIAIWFFNLNPPKMGVETAKTKTYQMLETVRNKVADGELTMKEAGKLLSETSELEEIDPSYKTNSYVKVEFHKPSTTAFTDPNINDLLWKINPGEVSQIITGRDSDGRGKWWDAYYAVIKITDKKLTQYQSVDDLINTRKREGEIIKLATKSI